MSKFNTLIPPFNTSILSGMKNFTFIEAMSKTVVGKMILLPYLQGAFRSLHKLLLLKTVTLAMQSASNPTMSSLAVIHVSSSDL